MKDESFLLEPRKMGRYSTLSPSEREKVKEKERARYWANREERARRNYCRCLAQGKVLKPRERTLAKHGITWPPEEPQETPSL